MSRASTREDARRRTRDYDLMCEPLVLAHLSHRVEAGVAQGVAPLRRRQERRRAAQRVVDRRQDEAEITSNTGWCAVIS